GSDLIRLTGGTVSGRVGLTDSDNGEAVLGNADDTIILSGTAVVLGDIEGDFGNDTIILTSAKTFAGSAFGDDGDDLIILNGAAVGGDIDGGVGNDTVVLASGSVGSVTGDDGNDVFELRGDIDLTGSILGGEGDDELIVFAGAAPADINAADGGAGNDTLTFDAFSGTITGLGTWESLGVQNGSTVTADGVTATDVSVEDSFIELTSATVSGSVMATDDGVTNEETIVLGAGTTVGGDVSAGIGDDTVVLDGGVVAEAGEIRLGAGDDIANLISGGFRALLAEEGSDTIVLNGLVDTGARVFGGDDDDTILLLSGALETAAGSRGNDTIRLSGATVPILNGNSGDDLILLDMGTTDEVRDGSGNDTIRLNGAVVQSGILNSAGADVIELKAGTLTGGVDASGEDGAGTDPVGDTIIVSGTVFIDGDIDGGRGDDTVLLISAQQISGSVFGGDGNDLIELRGALGLSGAIQGGDGEDELVLFDGAFDTDLTAATGGDGSDVVTFHNFTGTVTGAGEWETVGVRNDSDATLDGLTDLEAVRVEDSRIVLLDTEVAGDVFATDDGADNQEVIVLGSGTVIGGGVFGGLGDDSVELLAGFDPADIQGNLSGGAGLDGALFRGITGTMTGEQLVGWEIIDLAEETDLTLAGAVLTTGSTPGRGLFVREGSILRFVNDFVVDGNLSNFGTVDLGADGVAGTDLTVTGDYAAGSDLFLDVFVGPNGTLAADTLTIEGAATGDTLVTLTLVEDGQAGDDNSVLLISVTEPSTGTFTLSDAVISGLFELELVTEDDQNWILQSSEIFIGQAFAYESLPGALQAVGSAAIGTLAERVGIGGAVAGIDGPTLALPMANGAWARVVGISAESEGDLGNPTGGSFEQDLWLLQAGGEFIVSDTASGRLLIGGMAHLGQSTLDAFDRFGSQRSDIEIDAYGAGLSATWYGTGGFYADGVVQYTAYDVDLNITGGGQAGSTEGWGVAVSGEAGYRLPVTDNIVIVPQAQLVWQTVDFDDFVDRDGTRVRLDDGDSLVGRLGLSIEARQLFGAAIATGYAEANLLHEFLADNQVTAAGTTLTQDLGGTAAELGLGGALALSDSISLYGEVDYRVPFDDGIEAFQASGGLRINW
ncbi:MAG: autotransporter outer membrane beta-barrel domain-containing protein, partial [Pseudomonadota bacterium]